MKNHVASPTARYGMILPGSKDQPGGNSSEFPEIREALRERKVQWFERIVRNDAGAESTVFWVYGTELSKLPTDPQEGKLPWFLPGDPGESEPTGHGISQIDVMLGKHWLGTDIEYS